MKKNSYYDRTYERWITDVKSDNNTTLYFAFGLSKMESEYRADLVISAIETAKRLADELHKIADKARQ